MEGLWKAWWKGLGEKRYRTKPADGHSVHGENIDAE